MRVFGDCWMNLKFSFWLEQISVPGLMQGTHLSCLSTTWRFFLLGPSHSSGPTAGCLVFSLWTSISDSPASRLASSSPVNKLKNIHKTSSSWDQSDDHKVKSSLLQTSGDKDTELLFSAHRSHIYFCTYVTSDQSHFMLKQFPRVFAGTEGSPLEQEGKQCVGEAAIYYRLIYCGARMC